MDMLRNFPGLIPVNKQASIYTGYINICNEDFKIHVELPDKNKLEDLQFSCDWKLQCLLHDYTAILQQRLKQCSSLCQYLLEVKSLVERQLEGRQQIQQGGSQVCAQLLGEVEHLGWDKLVSIDAKFQTLELQCNDKKGRQHILKVTLSPQHPRIAPKCVVDLPGQFHVQWKATSDLQWLYQQFELAVDMYQDFIDVMEELDKKTWILEPENPVYSATYRRIAVSPNVSIQISVDYRHPRMLPECRFLGADQAVVPLRESLNSNLHLWDEQKGLLENLQILLGTELPSPSTSTKEEFSVECGICYAYRLDTELPNQACSDVRCGQPFHQTCLYEWLRALPSSRQSFNTIFGECPYCSKMDWLCFLVFCAVVFLLLQILMLLRSDCDLALKWIHLFGKTPGSLKGKVVWVTGASSGIGEALVLKLAAVGCRLVLSARREDKLQRLKERCVDQYGAPEDYLVLPLDLLDYNSHKGLVDTVLKYFKKIDCLVNNAGRSQRAVISKTSFTVDQQMLAVNTLGPISLTKAVLPVFIRQNSGHVVVTSSVAGKIGAPGLGSYCASKHALHGWFDCLRVESVMHNIQVTMACPGPVFSEALIHAFTEDPKKNLGVEMKPEEKRMTAARCAHLMAVAMANNMDEVWLTANPELSFLYMNQYLPGIFHWLAKRFGQKRFRKVLEGSSDLH